MAYVRLSGALLLVLSLGACGSGYYPPEGVKPNFTFPVSTNETPYSVCLRSLAAIPGNNLPTFAVGEVSDKTGQVQSEFGNAYSTALTQGVSEMVMSSLFKTRKVRLAERYDLRVPLAEMKMVEQGLVSRSAGMQRNAVQGTDYVVAGALTELNYNIVSEGARLTVGGVGGGARSVVINVALDMRVIDTRSFDVRYITSLQKQIFGYEVSANVFRFFGSQLVEFDAGRIRNEPLQLGVRSVVEMGVYQIMTDFLGLPGKPECALVQTNHFENYLTKKEK